VRATIAVVFFLVIESLVGNITQAQAANRLILPPLSFLNVRAYVTGYNTVPGQTDDTPCIAASGANICGRTDAVACPRRISLGTFLQIRGMAYVCEDRLAKKYDSRFDISCDKDTNCPGEVTGWVDIKIFAEDPCRLPSVARPVVALARPLLHLAAMVPGTLGSIVRSRMAPRAHVRWSRSA
jgi:hypothetical protein